MCLRAAWKSLIIFVTSAVANPEANNSQRRLEEHSDKRLLMMLRMAPAANSGARRQLITHDDTSAKRLQ